MIAAIISVFFALPAGAAENVLTPQAPIRIPRAVGTFDYMLVDAPLRRLLVAHTGSHAFAVLDLDSGALLAQIDVAGAPHGIAIDVARRSEDRRGLDAYGTQRDDYLMRLDP